MGSTRLLLACCILDVQLSLDFEPRCQKVRVDEACLLESHMRFVYSIPAHREYRCPPNPSCGGCYPLWFWRRDNPFVAFDQLHDMLETGLLDREELDGLTGLQLLLDAYHRAVEEEQGPETTPNFSAGCRLITFITMLFTYEHTKRILNSCPDNMEGSPFKKAFEALICFTHFGTMQARPPLLHGQHLCAIW